MDEDKLKRHPWVRTRLVWMQEHQPSSLVSVFQDGTLKERVLQEVKDALETQEMMLARGAQEQSAREIALDELAPTDCEPLSGRKVSDRMVERMLDEIRK